MIWLVVIMAAQSGALAYLIWTVRDLRKEMSAQARDALAELAETQAHEALKQQRIDQALADFGPTSPRIVVPMRQTEPAKPTPRPDRSAEQTGAWPYAGAHARHADETETLPATPPRRSE